jgi:predicted molibdopterin-dependent oxidoreductase YjgC
MSRPVWSILDDVATTMGSEIGALSPEAIGAEITRVAPAYAGVAWDRLSWGDDREGLVLPGPDGTQPLKHTPIDHGVPVVSGQRVLHTARVLYDDGVMVRHSSGISGLAARGAAYLHPRDASVLAVTEGDEIVIHVDGEVQLPVVIDPSLVEGTVYVPFNLTGTAGLGAVGTLRIDAVRGGDD